MSKKLKYRVSAAGIVACGTTLKAAKSALVYGRIAGNGADYEVKDGDTGKIKAVAKSWRINKLK
jgi:hypothetical protein